MAQHRSGFAMIEALCAFGIFAITLTFLAGTIISFSRLASVVEQQEQGAAQLAEVVERLRHVSRTELITNATNLFPDLGGNARVKIEYLTPDGGFAALPLDSAALQPATETPLALKVTLTRKDAHGVQVRLSAPLLCQAERS